VRRSVATLAALLALGASLASCGRDDVSQDEAEEALGGLAGVRSVSSTCAKMMAASTGCQVSVEATDEASPAELAAVLDAGLGLISDSDTVEIRADDWFEAGTAQPDLVLRTRTAHPLDPDAMEQVLEFLRTEGTAASAELDARTSHVIPADQSADIDALMAIMSAVDRTGVTELLSVQTPSALDPTLEVISGPGEDLTAQLDVYRTLAADHRFALARIGPFGLVLKTSTPEEAAKVQQEAAAHPRFGELGKVTVTAAPS
jgi:hypothetical protein